MEDINIGDFFKYLRRYIFAFILFIALAVGGMVAYDTLAKKPIYQAQTTIVIAAKSDNQDDSSATLNDLNVSQKLASTYSEIAKSDLVLDKVIKKLDLHTSAKALNKDLSIKPVSNTSILEVTVKNLDANLSAQIANEIVAISAKEIKTIYKTDNMTQLSTAAIPDKPINNTMVRDTIVAAVGAIVFVAGFAFLKFYFDNTVKYSEDVEMAIGLPVMGKISKREAKERKADELIVEKMPKAIVSENIKSLRTNLQFTAIDKKLKTILVTSTNASEGKSFVSANLAISFAQADKRVLLVDCDLRKGRVHRLFNISNSKGLSNLLANNLKKFSNYIHPTELKNLDIITCGTYPPNPSELLASKKNKDLIKMLVKYYDIVIFDGAPAGGLADSVILSSLVDETLIVVRNGETTKAELLATKDALDKVGAKIAGVVFNMINRNRAVSKYYSYYGESK